MSTTPRPPRFRRLHWLGVVVLVGVWGTALGWPMLVGALGGAWRPARGDWTAPLSPAARALWQASTVDLDLARRVDLHAHVAGLGTDGSGCRVNARMQSLAHPVEHVRLELYLSASGVRDREHADREFAERLTELADGLPQGARMALVAFDAHYDEDGARDDDATEFYVPNDWVLALCARDPARFVPVASVHPYRADALAELARCADAGARVVKWLPNAMGIDPASPRCDAFYDELARRGLLLLSHTGAELAVEAEADQELGNPLRLRRALDRGVRVVAAHCATLGTNVDLDDPAGAERPSYELFLRLMDEPRYVGRLFGELSGVTLQTRVGPALTALLERGDLHARFVDGSDWPLPALNVAISLGRLVEGGFLDAADEAPLAELYRAHPLAFDLALKRRLHAPASGARFAPEAFVLPPGLLGE